jgi:hypothetical protein
LRGHPTNDKSLALYGFYVKPAWVVRSMPLDGAVTLPEVYNEPPSRQFHEI